MADPLSGSLDAKDILVREAVQNSLDERLPDSDAPVRIRFQRHVLRADAKKRFVRHLRLRDFSKRRTRFKSDNNWFRKGNLVLNDLDDPDVELPTLSVSDYGANGLGGYWHRSQSRNDRFYNLVLSIAGSRKQENSVAGSSTLGSYGYGKMAFAMSSDLRTVIYYSTFRPDKSTGLSSCRAMACAYLPSHTIGDTDYAGQAYCGAPVPAKNRDHIPRQPLVDDYAHQWIESLGLPTRTADKTGTTVILPSVDVTMQDIVDACERWWWPRSLDREPAVRPHFEFVDADGEESFFQPRAQTDHHPFIDCFKLIRAPRAGRSFETHKVNVGRGPHKLAGRLVLKALPTDTTGAEVSPSRVALVRAGLVIRYAQGLASEEKPPVAGVFVPDESVMRFFILSEPPAHDEWQEHSQRLVDAGEDSADLIRLTKKRIGVLTRDFQMKQMTAPEREHTDAARFLQQTLGDIFRGPRGPRKPPLPTPRRVGAFLVRDQDVSRAEQNGGTIDSATFAVSLTDDAPTDTVPVVITISSHVVLDADGGTKEPISCTITECSDGQIENRADPTATTTLTRGAQCLVTAQAAVHPTWRTLWDVTVARDEDAKMEEDAQEHVAKT